MISNPSVLPPDLHGSFDPPLQGSGPRCLACKPWHGGGQLGVLFIELFLHHVEVLIKHGEEFNGLLVNDSFDALKGIAVVCNTMDGH